MMVDPNWLATQKRGLEEQRAKYVASLNQTIGALTMIAVLEQRMAASEPGPELHPASTEPSQPE